MPHSLDGWLSLLALFQPAFTAPGFALMVRLISAWVRCPGRHTLTRLYQLAEPRQERAHDAYHRFFGKGAWSMPRLWQLLARLLVALCYPQGPIPLDLDDTLFHKSGRKNQSAAWWRDAVRSTGQKVVHGFGLNLVVLTLRVQPPWGGGPLGLPVNMRLHRKHGPSLLELAQAMMQELADWLPERHFDLCADGFYAPLAGWGLPRTHLTSRIRRDAALFAPLSHTRRPRPRRGRPRTKGRPLPTPEQIAQHCRHWKRVAFERRGERLRRLVYTQKVLWYRVCSTQPVLLVICRDPTGREPDDFFFTTDLQKTATQVLEQYGGRWSIEDTFRNSKQSLRGQDPQLWKDPGPERAAAFCFWLYSLVWCWYLTTKQPKSLWIPLPWYPHKSMPSFTDALASLRRVLWRQSIFLQSGAKPNSRKNITHLIDVLAYAA
jgi:hypothetical protein